MARLTARFHLQTLIGTISSDELTATGYCMTRWRAICITTRTFTLLGRALTGVLLAGHAALLPAASLTDVLAATVRDLRVIERSGICNANPFKQNAFGQPVAPACAPVVAKCPVRMIPLSVKCTNEFVGGPSIPAYLQYTNEQDTLNRPGNEASCNRSVFTLSGEKLGYAGKSCTFQVPGIGETVAVRNAWGWCWDGSNYINGYDALGTQSGASYCLTQDQLNIGTGNCQSERNTLKMMCVTRPPESTIQKMQTLQGLDPF